MPASKRLRNAANLRGTPTEAQGGDGPRQHKRGLKGDMGAGGRFATKAGVEQTGVTEVLGGEAGVGGAANTFVGRGTSFKTGADARSVLDSDLSPLGVDTENPVLATFTVATGTGAVGTFDATGANTGKTMRVDVYTRDVDTDEDLAHVVTEYELADGTAKSIATGLATTTTVAVYAREVDDEGRSSGIAFATRRTVAVV